MSWQDCFAKLLSITIIEMPNPHSRLGGPLFPNCLITFLLMLVLIAAGTPFPPENFSISVDNDLSHSTAACISDIAWIEDLYWDQDSCENAYYKMAHYVSYHSTQVIEFYGGVPQAGFTTKQRTPIKFEAQSCTIAFVMRNYFPRGMVPKDPDGPDMKDWAYSSFSTLKAKARYTLDHCRHLREGKGSAGWAAAGERLPPPPKFFRLFLFFISQLLVDFG